MKFFLIIFIFSVSVGSCTYKKEVPTSTNPCASIGLNISYSRQVLPILQANCLSCHSNARQQGGTTLEGYNNVKNNTSGGLLVGVIEHTSGFSQMPKGAAKLNTCDIEAIKLWVQQGALNN